jgi:hypothetical protein
MPVVSATLDGLVSDQLTVRWRKGAPLGDVEGFLVYLLEQDGLGDAMEGDYGPRLEAEVGDGFCHLTPSADLWSMILAEELAIRLVRCQHGAVVDGDNRLVAAADEEDSRPWRALEAVGVISQFRPRPKTATDKYSHPLIPLDDCKISGVSFNEERECVIDVYFDYWARPCAFLVDPGEEPILLYRPMYRFREAIFGRPDPCSVTMKAPPQSRIYGAVGVKGYKIDTHRVDKRHIWTMKGQNNAFSLRVKSEDAWLTRSWPLWYRGDRLLLGALHDGGLTAEDLLQRKEQHWDIVDSAWGQEWYVAAHEDGSLNPFGRIYRADSTAALLDLPGLKPELS